MGYYFGDNNTKADSKESPKFQTVKQFKSKVGTEPVSPEVALENIKKSVEVKSWEVNTLEKKIDDQKSHLKSGQLYLDLLKLYTELSDSEKKSIKNWIIDNYKAIKKYGDYKKLKKETEEAKQVNKLQNIELKYNLNLLKLKNEGVDPFKTVTRVATYRPTQEKIELYKSSNKPLPIFKGASPLLKPVKLNKNGIAISSGLGDSDQETNNLMKPFISTLPGQKQEDEAEEKRLAPTLLQQKTQSLTERLPKIEMDLGTLDKESFSLEKKLANLQQNINKLIKNIEPDTATALGILVELKPERFTTSASIIAGLKSVLNNIKSLSGFGQTQSSSPLDQAQQLLSNQLVESTEVVAQVDLSSKLLTNAQNALVGKPIEPVTTEAPSSNNKKSILVGITILIGLLILFRRS